VTALRLCPLQPNHKGTSSTGKGFSHALRCYKKKRRRTEEKWRWELKIKV